MKTITTAKEMQAFSENSRRTGKTVALVPTMGSLHQGHLKLMEEGRRMSNVLVASIFVNPTQFGVGEDLEQYPRGMDRDKKLAEGIGVDVIFAPSSEEMYPKGYQTYVNVEKVTNTLCGISRPTHFRGVTTVVAKLFNIIKPHIAIFGEKDFQQLLTVKKMVQDLNFDIHIVGIPTVREEDGLAMSSRNMYLTKKEHQAALKLNRSIAMARDFFQSGEKRGEKIIHPVRKTLESESLIEIEYIKLCDIETLEDIERIDRDCVLAMAVRIGKTRLIDNTILKHLP